MRNNAVIRKGDTSQQERHHLLLIADQSRVKRRLTFMHVLLGNLGQTQRTNFIRYGVWPSWKLCGPQNIGWRVPGAVQFQKY